MVRAECEQQCGVELPACNATQFRFADNGLIMMTMRVIMMMSAVYDADSGLVMIWSTTMFYACFEDDYDDLCFMIIAR